MSNSFTASNRKIIVQRPTVALLVLGLLLAGCSATNRQTGTAIGAVGGALVGSVFGRGTGQLVAAGVGALIGAMIGNKVGKSLDEREKKALKKATTTAVADGQTGRQSHWRIKNTDGETTAHGWVVPTSAVYTTRDGECRDVQQVAIKNGARVEDEIKLCRDPDSGDGAWKIPS